MGARRGPGCRARRGPGSGGTCSRCGVYAVLAQPPEDQAEDRTRRTERQDGARESGGQAAPETQKQARPEAGYRSYAQELDARRAREAGGQRRRDELRNRLDETYRRTEIEQQLNAARANAKRTDTFWGRLTGRH